MARRLTVDGSSGSVNLQGLYEAVSSDRAHYPGFILQINNIGLVCVGWVSQAPMFVTPVTGLRSFPSVGGARCGYLTFSCPMSPTPISSGGFALPVWFEDHPADGVDINTYDPMLSDTGGRPGALRIEHIIEGPLFGITPATPHPDIPALREWQVTGVCFDATNGARVFDPVRRVSRLPRLPYSYIETVAPLGTDEPDTVRDALVAVHVAPLPEPYVVKILSTATKLLITGGSAAVLESTREPPLSERAIKNWIEAPPLARNEMRRNVLWFLEELARRIKGLPYRHQQEKVIAMFVDHSTTTYYNDDDKHSYHRLYMQAIAEELGEKPSVTVESSLYPVLAIGLFPNAPATSKTCYRYTLSFSEVGSTSALLKLAKKLLWWAEFFPIAIGLAALEVKCENVELEIDENGVPKMDRVSGRPVVKTVLGGAVYDSHFGSPQKHTAITFTVGLFPRLPGAVEMFSIFGDVQYSDFGEASFKFGWGKLLRDVELGPYANIGTPETGFLEITLPRRNGFTMFGSTTNILSLTNKVTQTFQDFTSGGIVKKGKTVKPVAEDVIKKGAEAAAEGWLDTLKMKGFIETLKGSLTPGTVSIGGGYICEPNRRPDVTVAPAASTLTETFAVNGSVTRALAYFKRDNADIDLLVQKPVEFGTWWDNTQRSGLEFFMAKYIALIANPGTTIELDGHASPEGPLGPLPAGQFDPYNQELSIARVHGVSQAITDAMRDYYKDWQWPTTIDNAHGEELARSHGPGGGALQDPPGTRNRPAFRQWAIANKREYDQWPDWRRVDVRIGSAITLRLCD